MLWLVEGREDRECLRFFRSQWSSVMVSFTVLESHHDN